MNPFLIIGGLFATAIFFNRGRILATVINEIREKYSSGFARKIDEITEFVIHGTGGGSSAMGLIKWMLGGERAEEYKKGVALFHYLLDKDGTAYNIIDPLKWVFHSSSGQHDIHTIGTELVNSSKNNSDAYTDAQYKALASLIAQSKKKFPKLKTITTHNYNGNKFSNAPKSCPNNFSFVKLQGELSKLMVNSRPSVAGLELI